MKKFMQAIAKHLPDMVLVAGAAAIAVGIGLIYLPAGVIAGGILAIAGVIFAGFGAGDAP